MDVCKLKQKTPDKAKFRRAKLRIPRELRPVWRKVQDLKRNLDYGALVKFINEFWSGIFVEKPRAGL